MKILSFLKFWGAIPERSPVLLYHETSLATAFPVFTRSRIEAFVRDHQALDWLAADDVRVDDFIDISFGDVAIPDSVGIDDKIRAVLALIEATGLIGPHFAFEAAFRQFLLEYFLECRL